MRAMPRAVVGFVAAAALASISTFALAQAAPQVTQFVEKALLRLVQFLSQALYRRHSDSLHRVRQA